MYFSVLDTFYMFAPISIFLCIAVVSNKLYL